MFDNRTISEKLDINFEKVRRWSREFVPTPLPKGYKREYSFGEAFKIFLGGYCVSQMGLSIPEAKTVLTDLNDWFEKQGFLTFSGSAETQSEKYPLVKSWEIHIVPGAPSRFSYTFKGSLDGPKMIIFKGFQAQQEIFIDGAIAFEKVGHRQTVEVAKAKILRISMVRALFLGGMGLV